MNGELSKMDGNTFIGGLSVHREQFWCERCGHIQWNTYTSSDMHMCDYKDHIECKICKSKKMMSKSDIESEIWMLPGFIHIMKCNGKDPRELIGKKARWMNILQEMKLRERD